MTPPGPETQTLPPAWWYQPYAETALLAGYLSAEELPGLYPASRQWPADISERVERLLGAAAALPPLPPGDRCLLPPVEEPEALRVLQSVAPGVNAPPNVPLGFSWVPIRDLVAVSAVADRVEAGATLTGRGLQALAEYSLFGPPPSLFVGGGVLFSSAPVAVGEPNTTLQPGEVIVRYKLGREFRPIIVGYEAGRLFLLSEYDRVLHALEQGVERLICLVHYGLDLAEPDLGIRLLGIQGTFANHFGPARLLGPRPPMVRDFLDPAIAVAVPTRTQLRLTQFIAQTTDVSFGLPPQGELAWMVARRTEERAGREQA